MREKMKNENRAGAGAERKAKTPEQALAALMRYASRAERSSGDASRLMRRWGIGESDSARILQRLMEMGFIDDRRFADAYVREKNELSGWGVHKIRNGLRAKEIAPQIVEQALGRLMDSGRENARLDDIIGRKLRSVRAGTKYEVKGKLLRFGLSRGYGYEAVMEAVERALAGFPDEED